jgi:hypothetical protein
MAARAPPLVCRMEEAQGSVGTQAAEVVAKVRAELETADKPVAEAAALLRVAPEAAALEKEAPAALRRSSAIK